MNVCDIIILNATTDVQHADISAPVLDLDDVNAAIKPTASGLASTNATLTQANRSDYANAGVVGLVISTHNNPSKASRSEKR